MAAPAASRMTGSPVVEDLATSLNLKAHGLINPGTLFARLGPAQLTELSVSRGESMLAANGALVAYTGERTGRSPQDRYLVADPSDDSKIAWGAVNRKLEGDVFQRLYHKVLAYFQGRDLFITDAWACADPRHRIGVRVVTEKAWQALFANCLFLRPPIQELARGFRPDITILAAPGLKADPETDNVRSSAFIILNIPKRLVVIGGTHYAGEIKKSVFSFLNYLLPAKGVFPMHCSANIGKAGDTALFFGLSGTGKTTLSADPDRRLIGDDEHGWSDEGVFNIEGGCYAKTIRLSREGEPQIWNALRFGSILENVVIDPATRVPDYDDDEFTENTRAAYPVDYIDNSELSGRGGHPANVVFLTCDAFGVLPPISRLTHEQAMYHFLSGYTAKVAGTEAGVTEPQTVFSTCFAAPFLPLHPTRYAEMLRDKLKSHGSKVWLINTGWTGGPYGKGSRMKLSQTRSMVRAALSSELAKVEFTADPIFGAEVPLSCPGVPPDVLQPRKTWPSPSDYDSQARKLAGLFVSNFDAYANQVSETVRQSGPRV